MDALVEFYKAVREAYPEIADATDKVHVETWGEPESYFAYSWFGSLATKINGDMNKGIAASYYRNLFSFFDQTLRGCGSEIRHCIDVSFVENLFWQVPADKAGPYWIMLPASLKALYTGFHNRSPTNSSF